jgi:hypothetical protein
MAGLLKSDTCATCAHRYRENKEIQCRRNPPAAHPILVGTPQGPRLAGTLSVFPVVQETQWCGEHKKLIVAARE